MDIIVLGFLASGVILLLCLIAIFRRPSDQKEEKVPARVPPAGRGHEGPRVRRMRTHNLRGHGRHIAQPRDESDEADDDDEELKDLEFSDKVGTKKRAKLQAKADKKAQREVELRGMEEEKKRKQQEDEDRLKTEERLKQEKERELEEERKAIEEKERKEHEEYLKMKEMFSVEEEGYDKTGDAESEETLLHEFLSYIKKMKVVVLEDLAATFKLKTQTVIDRIQDLQKDGILTGVIDDRGKFIYISQEELTAVAKFVKQRGRVSITELAESSNQLINLNPVKSVEVKS